MALDTQALSALVQRCRAGDKAAWDQLVGLYWQRLFAYAYKATQDSDLASDLVQETLLRVVQKLQRYSDEGKFEAWLFRIVVNLVRDKARANARRPLRSIVMDSESGLELTDRMPGRENVDTAEHREEKERLYDALQKLPELDRQVLLLRHYGCLSFKEIATITGCPLGTILARAHRALGKMRVMMEVDHETS
jgi:RNA polymerase sigma-70 factor (ECF subfamily)